MDSQPETESGSLSKRTLPHTLCRRGPGDHGQSRIPHPHPPQPTGTAGTPSRPSLLRPRSPSPLPRTLLPLPSLGVLLYPSVGEAPSDTRGVGRGRRDSKGLCELLIYNKIISELVQTQVDFITTNSMNSKRNTGGRE